MSDKKGMMLQDALVSVVITSMIALLASTIVYVHANAKAQIVKTCEALDEQMQMEVERMDACLICEEETEEPS